VVRELCKQQLICWTGPIPSSNLSCFVSGTIRLLHPPFFTHCFCPIGQPLTENRNPRCVTRPFSSPSSSLTSFCILLQIANWATGYGDDHLQPDLGTLRTCSWLEKTALVLCDVQTESHQLAPHAPRSILQSQVAGAKSLGFQAMAATEVRQPPFFATSKSVLLHVSVQFKDALSLFKRLRWADSIVRE
jgi:hypothetical protein